MIVCYGHSCVRRMAVCKLILMDMINTNSSDYDSNQNKTALVVAIRTKSSNA